MAVQNPVSAVGENDAVGSVASPCVRQCTLDPRTDRCVGCLRTLDEIKGWSRYSPAQRRAVLAELRARTG